MRYYLLKRLLAMAPVFVGITMITFVVIQMAPGEPMDYLMSPNLPRAEVEQIRANLGLNLPIFSQYRHWFMNILTLDLGHSFVSGRPVAEMFLEALPATLLLTGTGFLVTLFCSIILGTTAAVKQNTRVDHIISLITYVGQSIPTFWLGLIIIYLFSVKLGLFPATGMYNLRIEEVDWIDRLRHLILPVITITIPSMASWTRYIRSSVLEVIREDYIRTARAKGLSEWWVLYKHVLKNALLPLITLAGLQIPHLIEGACIVEAIFGWPGLGQVGISAVFLKDYPVVMALNTVLAIIVLLTSLATDWLYGIIDPRIRLDEEV